jgi:hypothetical protein
MAAILRFMTLTDLWARAGEMFSTAGRERHVREATRWCGAPRQRAGFPVSIVRWDRARNAGKRQKNQGLRKATAGMLMQRSFIAERVSNMLGLLIHVSDDRIGGVLGPKAAIGRSNSVAMCG